MCRDEPSSGGAPPSGPPRGANPAELSVHGTRRSCRGRLAKALENRDRAQTFTFADTVGTGGVFGDRLAHDMALRPAEPFGGAADLRHRRIVQRERDLYHIDAILPYRTDHRLVPGPVSL